MNLNLKNEACRRLLVESNLEKLPPKYSYSPKLQSLIEELEAECSHLFLLLLHEGLVELIDDGNTQQDTSTYKTENRNENHE